MPAALIISLMLGLLYARTIAPGLTWANFSADGGDFLAAIATGGVPHPGGYPLYLLLGGLFARLPFGEPAFRTNLLSAFCTILTANLVALISANWLAGKPGRSWLALLAGLAYGLSPFAWGQALVTEVYSLHALLVCLCLLAWSAKRHWWVGLTFGLAAANHLTALLVLPLLVLGGDAQRWRPAPRAWLARFLGLLSGLSLYLLLPLRAATHPAINWGGAASLPGLAWLVSGRMYSGFLLDPPLVDVVGRLRGLAGLLLEQFGPLGVFLAVGGLLMMPRGRERLAGLWIVLANGAFAILYNSSDSQVYLAPVWPVLAAWMAVGLGSLVELAGSSRRGQWLLAGLLAGALALLLMRVPRIYQQVDLSQDERASGWITHTLDAIPSGALVFVSGDQQVFGLWYAQFAQGRRPDVVMMADGLLAYRWYLNSLADVYPRLGIPVTEQAQARDFVALNPGQVFCRLERDSSEPVCEWNVLPPGQ